jgi:hypothetical protein
MNSEQLTHWKEQARAFVKMLGEMVYGATVYEMVRDLNKERGMIERLFILVRRLPDAGHRIRNLRS